jgi:hypothetical protein
MKPPLDEAARGPRAVLVGIGAAVIVGLGLIALQGTSPPSTVPPVEPTILWTPERLELDWPVAVRPEPAGRLVPAARMILGDDARWDASEALWGPFEFGDGLGDGVPGDMPWLDIREVHLKAWPRGDSSFRLVLAGPAPGDRPAPADRWMAYGLVLDTDGDGRADQRVGMDNIAGGDHRAWWAHLTTGAVSWKAGPPYIEVGGRGEGQGGARTIALETWYPQGDGSAGREAIINYAPGAPDFRFYAWAGLIQGGRVVALDYAPDAGWLRPGIQPVLTFAGPIWWHETVFRRDGTSFELLQTMSVTPDGRLRINAACHVGTADLAIGPETLGVSDLALEETDCRGHGPASLEGILKAEDRLLKMLSAETISYSIEAGVLELRAGSRHIRFTARFQGPPGL